MSEGQKASIRFVLPKWLKHSDRPISAIDIHPSGEFFATGGWDTFCKIWNFNAIKNPEEDIENKLLAVLRDHTKPINAVCFSPDGKYLATGGDDCMVFLWQKVRSFGRPSTFGIPDHVLKPNHPVQRWQSKTLVGHSGDVTGVCWYPDSTKIASCSIDGMIFVWDVKTCSKLYCSPFDTKFSLKSISVDPLSKFIALQRMDGKLAIYDPATSFYKEYGQDFMGPEQAMVNRICWTPDGSFVSLTGANSGGFVTPFFRRESFQFGFMLEGHVAPTSAVACPNFLYRDTKKGHYSTMIACGDKSGVISIWLVGEKTTPLCVLDHVSNSTINDMCWSKDGRYLLVALESCPVTTQGGVVVFDVTKMIDGIEPVDSETMEEVKSHLLGENSFRLRSAQSNKQAQDLLRSLDTEEKDIDLEVLQLTTDEVLQRQITKVVDGVTYITPVLLTAVEKQMIAFKMTVESPPLPHLSSDYTALGKKWQKPASIQGVVNQAIDAEDYHIIAYSGYVLKLEKKTGRRLSSPFFIGGPCKHLSYNNGVILAVGKQCYLIQLNTMQEIMHCSCPEGFIGFALNQNNIISAHLKGRTWVWDEELSTWRGGAMTKDASDLTMDEIEVMTKTESALQWSELGQTAMFGCYARTYKVPNEIIAKMTANAEKNEAAQAYVKSLKQTIAKRWPEAGILP